MDVSKHAVITRFATDDKHFIKWFKVSENYGAKHFCKMFPDTGLSFNGLMTPSIKWYKYWSSTNMDVSQHCNCSRFLQSLFLASKKFHLSQAFCYTLFTHSQWNVYLHRYIRVLQQHYYWRLVYVAVSKGYLTNIRTSFRHTETVFCTLYWLEFLFKWIRKCNVCI